MRRLILSVVALVAFLGTADAAFVGTQRALLSAPTAPQSLLDLNAASGIYTKAPSAPTTDITTVLTISRASSGTDLLPSSASGFAYTTFGNNIARVTAGLGLLSEQSRVNRLLNSAAPATQTTGSLANGLYVLWVNGSGSATMSAGTATGCGTGVAMQGVPVSFTLSGAPGNCVVTVAGALNAFQLELATTGIGSSFIVTAGAIATRAADIITVTDITGISKEVGTFVATIRRPNDTGSTIKYIYEFNDDSFVNRIYGVVTSTLQTQIFSNSVNVAQFGRTVSEMPGTLLSIGNSYSMGRVVGANIPGVILRNIATVAFVIPPAVTKLFLGAHGTASSSQLNGYLARLRYFPYFVSERTLRNIAP